MLCLWVISVCPVLQKLHLTLKKPISAKKFELSFKLMENILAEVGKQFIGRVWSSHKHSAETK